MTRPGPKYHRKRIPAGSELEDRYLAGVAECAKFYGVSVSCVYYWRQRPEHLAYLETLEPLQGVAPYSPQLMRHLLEKDGAVAVERLDAAYPAWESQIHESLRPLVASLRSQAVSPDRKESEP